MSKKDDEIIALNVKIAKLEKSLKSANETGIGLAVVLGIVILGGLGFINL